MTMTNRQKDLRSMLKRTTASTRSLFKSNHDKQEDDEKKKKKHASSVTTTTTTTTSWNQRRQQQMAAASPAKATSTSSKSNLRRQPLSSASKSKLSQSPAITSTSAHDRVRRNGTTNATNTTTPTSSSASSSSKIKSSPFFTLEKSTNKSLFDAKQSKSKNGSNANSSKDVSDDKDDKNNIQTKKSIATTANKKHNILDAMDSIFASPPPQVKKKYGSGAGSSSQPVTKAAKEVRDEEDDDDMGKKNTKNKRDDDNLTSSSMRSISSSNNNNTSGGGNSEHSRKSTSLRKFSNHRRHPMARSTRQLDGVYGGGDGVQRPASSRASASAKSDDDTQTKEDDGVGGDGGDYGGSSDHRRKPTSLRNFSDRRHPMARSTRQLDVDASSHEPQRPSSTRALLPSSSSRKGENNNTPKKDDNVGSIGNGDKDDSTRPSSSRRSWLSSRNNSSSSSTGGSSNHDKEQGKKTVAAKSANSSRHRRCSVTRDDNGGGGGDKKDATTTTRPKRPTSWRASLSSSTNKDNDNTNNAKNVGGGDSDKKDTTTNRPTSWRASRSSSSKKENKNINNIKDVGGGGSDEKDTTARPSSSRSLSSRNTSLSSLGNNGKTGTSDTSNSSRHRRSSLELDKSNSSLSSHFSATNRRNRLVRDQASSNMSASSCHSESSASSSGVHGRSSAVTTRRRSGIPATNDDDKNHQKVMSQSMKNLIGAFDHSDNDQANKRMSQSMRNLGVGGSEGLLSSGGRDGGAEARRRQISNLAKNEFNPKDSVGGSQRQSVTASNRRDPQRGVGRSKSDTGYFKTKFGNKSTRNLQTCDEQKPTNDVTMKMMSQSLSSIGFNNGSVAAWGRSSNGISKSDHTQGVKDGGRFEIGDFGSQGGQSNKQTRESTRRVNHSKSDDNDFDVNIGSHSMRNLTSFVMGRVPEEGTATTDSLNDEDETNDANHKRFSQSMGNLASTGSVNSGGGSRENLQQRLLQQRLMALMEDDPFRCYPENQVCCDCSDEKQKPIWACLIMPPSCAPLGSPMLGMFCCFQCAGVHRGLGTHVCRVKSLHLDTWDGDEVVAMERGGNKTVNSIFEAKDIPESIKASAKSDPKEREAFIRRKYVQREYYQGWPYRQVLKKETATATTTTTTKKIDSLSQHFDTNRVDKSLNLNSSNRSATSEPPRKLRTSADWIAQKFGSARRPARTSKKKPTPELDGVGGCIHNDVNNNRPSCVQSGKEECSVVGETATSAKGGGTDNAAKRPTSLRNLGNANKKDDNDGPRHSFMAKSMRNLNQSFNFDPKEVTSPTWKMKSSIRSMSENRNRNNGRSTSMYVKPSAEKAVASWSSKKDVGTLAEMSKSMSWLQSDFNDEDIPDANKQPSSTRSLGTARVKPSRSVSMHAKLGPAVKAKMSINTKDGEGNDATSRLSQSMSSLGCAKDKISDNGDHRSVRNLCSAFEYSSRDKSVATMFRSNARTGRSKAPTRTKSLPVRPATHKSASEKAMRDHDSFTAEGFLSSNNDGGSLPTSSDLDDQVTRKEQKSKSVSGDYDKDDLFAAKKPNPMKGLSSGVRTDEFRNDCRSQERRSTDHDNSENPSRSLGDNSQSISSDDPLVCSGNSCTFSDDKDSTHTKQASVSSRSRSRRNFVRGPSDKSTETTRRSSSRMQQCGSASVSLPSTSAPSSSPRRRAESDGRRSRRSSSGLVVMERRKQLARNIDDTMAAVKAEKRKRLRHHGRAMYQSRLKNLRELRKAASRVTPTEDGQISTNDTMGSDEGEEQRRQGASTRKPSDDTEMKEQENKHGLEAALKGSEVTHERRRNLKQRTTTELRGGKVVKESRRNRTSKAAAKVKVARATSKNHGRSTDRSGATLTKLERQDKDGSRGHEGRRRRREALHKLKLQQNLKERPERAPARRKVDMKPAARAVDAMRTSKSSDSGLEKPLPRVAAIGHRRRQRQRIVRKEHPQRSSRVHHTVIKSSDDQSGAQPAESSSSNSSSKQPRHSIEPKSTTQLLASNEKGDLGHIISVDSKSNDSMRRAPETSVESIRAKDGVAKPQADGKEFQLVRMEGKWCFGEGSDHVDSDYESSHEKEWQDCTQGPEQQASVKASSKTSTRKAGDDAIPDNSENQASFGSHKKRSIQIETMTIRQSPIKPPVDDDPDIAPVPDAPVSKQKRVLDLDGDTRQLDDSLPRDKQEMQAHGMLKTDILDAGAPTSSSVPSANKNERIFFMDNPSTKLADVSVREKMKIQQFSTLLPVNVGAAYPSIADNQSVISNCKERMFYLSNPNAGCQVRAKPPEKKEMQQRLGMLPALDVCTDDPDVVDIPSVSKQGSRKFFFDMPEAKIGDGNRRHKTEMQVFGTPPVLPSQTENDEIRPLVTNWRQRIFFSDSEDRLDRSIEITVLHWSGASLPLDDIRSVATVEEVKQRIFERFSIEKNLYRLRFLGRVVDDEKSLLKQNIGHKSVLTMECIQAAKFSGEIPGTTKQDFGILSAGTSHKITLVVRHWNGEMFSLEAESTEYIDDLKDRIHEARNIPLHHQRITFQGKPVDDACSLQEQDIGHLATLTLEPLEIYVAVPGGKQLTLPIELSYTIERVKQLVSEKIAGAPTASQLISAGGEELANDRTLLQCGIDLTMEIYEIRALHWTGKNIPLSNIGPNNTIDDVKGTIEDQTNTPKGQYQLCVNGKTLHETMTLKEQAIRHKSVLVMHNLHRTLESQPPSEHTKFKLSVLSSPRASILSLKKTVQIAIKLWNEEVVKLDCCPTDYISDIKERIKDQKDIPVEHQRLTLDGDLVMDECTVLEQKIDDQSLLVMEPLQIHVQILPEGRKVTIPVHLDCRMDQVKKLASEAAGVVVDSQCLLLGGEELKDQQTVLESNIEHDDMITMEEFSISALHWTGQKVLLSGISPWSTTDDVDDVVVKLLKISKDEHRLSHLGKALGKDGTLRDQGIRHKSILVVQNLRKMDEIVPMTTPTSLAKNMKYQLPLLPKALGSLPLQPKTPEVATPTSNVSNTSSSASGSHKKVKVLSKRMGRSIVAAFQSPRIPDSSGSSARKSKNRIPFLSPARNSTKTPLLAVDDDDEECGAMDMSPMDRKAKSTSFPC